MPTDQPTTSKQKLRWYQFSLRSLMTTITLVAILLSGYKVYVILNEPPFSAFLTKWKTEIHNGDQINKVQAVLGIGRKPDDTSWITEKIQSNPDSYPDGLEKSDRFLLYEVRHGKASTVLVYVQFRKDRLVNHIPDRIQAVHFVGPSGE